MLLEYSVQPYEKFNRFILIFLCGRPLVDIVKKLLYSEVHIFVFRVVYMLQQDPPEICLKTVEHLVIDESDKLFEAGVRGFRDQVKIDIWVFESLKFVGGVF